MPLPRLWFRAFDRPDAKAFLAALLTGDEPSPNPDSATKIDERQLGISTPHVYAYLSALNPKFSFHAVALDLEVGRGGVVTPFDSGGALRKIHPMAAMTDPVRNATLLDYSWSEADFEAKFLMWPGAGPAAWERYSTLTMPTVAGPHVPLAVKRPLPIWHNKNQWQAWVWELRVPGRMPFGKAIIGWTCDDKMMRELRKEASVDPSFLASLEGLMPKWVDGGSSILIESMREPA